MKNMTSKLQNKKIGGFEVNPIGIGTWGVGGWFKSDNRKDKKQIKAIRYSIEKGQNHIDTVELYSDGHSEEIVGKAIEGFDREKLFIASKVWKDCLNPTDVVESVEKMLGRIKTDYLDLVYMHSPRSEGTIADYIEGINKAQDKGLTKAIGVSNFKLEQLNEAVRLTKYPIIAIQNHYNVMYQSEVDKKMKIYCMKNNTTIVAYSPLENCQRSVEALRLAEKYDKTPQQIVLNWLISQDGVITIPKSTNKKHINTNLGVLDFEMSNTDLKLLNER